MSEAFQAGAHRVAAPGSVHTQAPAGGAVRRHFRTGIAFRHTSAGARLYVFERSRLQVIAVEGGTVRQWLVHTNGAFRGSRRPISLEIIGREARRATRDDDGQLRLFPLWSDHAACRDFLEALPPGVYERARVYPPAMHFRMLSFFVRCGQAAFDLHDGGACGLCAALAGLDRFSPARNPTRAARRWVWQPQPAVLGKLGWPGTRTAARTLRKLAPEACNFWVLHALRRGARKPETARRLAHLRRLNEFVAWSVSRPDVLADRLGWPLIEEGSRLPSAEAIGLICQVRTVLEREQEFVEREVRSPAPRKFTSAAQLVRVSERLLAAQNELQHGQRDRVVFPEPPLADVPGFITWIRSGRALRTEGDEMRHCVLTCLAQAAAGQVAIARVTLPPDRATLRLRRYEFGWSVDEVKGPENSEPSAALLSALKNWWSSCRAWEARPG